MSTAIATEIKLGCSFGVLNFELYFRLLWVMLLLLFLVFVHAACCETMIERITGVIIFGVLCELLRSFVSFPQQKQEPQDTESNSQSQQYRDIKHYVILPKKKTDDAK